VGTLGILGLITLVLPEGRTCLRTVGHGGRRSDVRRRVLADKIPAFDLIWNAMHTFVRIPVAALLAYKATASLSPGEQMLATIVGGLIALAAQRRKNCCKGGSHAFPGTLLQWSPQLNRGRQWPLPDLARNSTPLCSCGARPGGVGVRGFDPAVCAAIPQGSVQGRRGADSSTVSPARASLVLRPRRRPKPVGSVGSRTCHSTCR